MKKIVLLVLSVLSCGAAVALPVGNPSEASLYTKGIWWCNKNADSCFGWLDSFSLRSGFYGDYVFNRHMQVEESSVANRGIGDTQLFTNAGIVVLNFCNWIEAFATFGATSMNFSTNEITFKSATTEPFHVEFATHFSWSVGGRATVWRYHAFNLGVEGEYFRFQPNINYALSVSDGTYFYENGASSTYSEWQVALGASYRLQANCSGFAMVPYVAVKWAHSTLNMHDLFIPTGLFSTPITLYQLESARLWGYAVGVTATVNDAMGLSVEARFADESAVYTTMQLRF